MELILNQKKAAAMLGVSSITLWRWRNEGRVHALPQFKTPKYSVEELQRLSKQNPVTQEAA